MVPVLWNVPCSAVIEQDKGAAHGKRRWSRALTPFSSVDPGHGGEEWETEIHSRRAGEISIRDLRSDSFWRIIKWRVESPVPYLAKLIPNSSINNYGTLTRLLILMLMLEKAAFIFVGGCLYWLLFPKKIYHNFTCLWRVLVEKYHFFLLGVSELPPFFNYNWILLLSLCKSSHDDLFWVLPSSPSFGAMIKSKYVMHQNCTSVV